MRCPALWTALVFASSLAVLSGGCGDGRSDAALDGVPLSPELRPLVEAARVALEDPDQGHPAIARDLDLYADLQAALCDPDRRGAAVDSLFAAWTAAPTNFLWPELAMRNRSYLGNPERLKAIFAHADLSDTTTAIGAYMRGWRNVGYTSGGEEFRRAWAMRETLEPLQAVWLTLKLAWIERLAGRGERALSLATQALPRARELGGRRAELAVWTEITRALKKLDRLDDALHALGVADGLAAAVTRETGNVFVTQTLRLLRADVLAARRENRAALALYETCADTCLDHRLLTLAAKSLNRGGILTAGTGDYGTGLRLYRKSLRIALAADDSLNVPRHLMNIARRHRLMGRLDSCLVYQRRAEVWVDAYPDLRNRARLPLMQAEYHAQVGDYATVDSLLTAAAAMTPNLTTMEALAELHLQIIKDGLERGSPGAAYRSIALLDSLRGRLADSLADRHVTVDLDLHTAEFLTRQGLYARALAALERARAALARRPDPARAWQLARTRGALSRRRGDLTGAESAFRDCVATAERIDDPDLLATGSLLLSAVLMDQDRFAEARAVLGGDGGRFRTRLTMRLFRGATYTREGLHDDALAELAAARAQCTPRSPRDLVARIDLETGRALAGNGRVKGAGEAYARVREELSRHGTVRLSGHEADYYGDLRRELVEAELSLATRRGPGAVTGRAAREALARTCALLPQWRTASGIEDAAGQAPQVIFFCGEDASFRWDLSASGPTLRRLDGERALATRLGTLLADLGRPGREPVAAEMAALVAALGGFPEDWRDGQTLRVVPDGALHGVPWAALHGPRGRDGWLDRGPIAISNAPAPRIATPTRPARPGRLLALGADDAPAAGLASLRHAELEAREIHDRWPAGRAELRVGGSTVAGDLRSEPLDGYDVIHVASHAVVYRGSSREASLMLDGDRDVPLTLPEIRDLGLDAELVYLSCCEAADGSALSAGQAHADLASGFLDAGASAVVAPTLMIEDEAARRLAGRFYDGWLAGRPAAVALRDAPLAMRDGAPRRAHPFYWAFYLVLTAGGT